MFSSLQPGRFDARGQVCVAMGSELDYKWKDLLCSEDANWICQYGNTEIDAFFCFFLTPTLCSLRAKSTQRLHNKSKMDISMAFFAFFSLQHSALYELNPCNDFITNQRWIFFEFSSLFQISTDIL